MELGEDTLVAGVEIPMINSCSRLLRDKGQKEVGWEAKAVRYRCAYNQFKKNEIVQGRSNQCEFRARPVNYTKNRGRRLQCHSEHRKTGINE